jgi:hypothetical protein
LTLAAWPSAAEAQHRFRRSGVRIGVGVGTYWPPYYQRPYWSPYPPYGYRYSPFEVWATLRLQVTPSEAQVFVDGYNAGEVDDYDGIFQRLRVPPGAHEITIYLEGYRTVRRALYLNPDTHQNIKLTMEPLGPGETSEPPPPPSRPAREPQSPGAPMRPAPTEPPQPPPARAPVEYFGAIALTVDPPDAEIYVDGERWTPAAGESRSLIRLREGRHRIEIRKEGYTTFSETVGIFRDTTMTLNVTLKRDGL